MKLDTLDHPKTFNLTALLGCSMPCAIGYLQYLWRFTGQHATQGNVGKWPDGAIARACLWEGDAEKFINGLVEAGFLDRSEDHRLIVHDWHEHAPGWVFAKLKKAGLGFVHEKSLENGQEKPLESNQEKGQEQGTEATGEPTIRGEERSGKERSGEGNGKKPPSRKFIKPTIPEIREYCNEIGATFKPSKFYNYYEANGWKVGKNPMKDWKAAVRNWQSREGG